MAEEITAIGGSDVTIGRRMVSFMGDKAMLYKANLACRTALRILKPILHFEASNPDEVYNTLLQYNWEDLMDVTTTFSIDSVVFSDEFRHSKFVTYRMKDAIADYFNERYGKRPSVRLTNADIQFNLHINNTSCTLSLDSSGESLHKRGYRDAQTFLKESFEENGEVYISTEDGSVGTKGNVMHAIAENKLEADIIYACGPTPMLRAIKKYAEENGIECYISLEERMACGIGACLACVCKSQEKDHHSNVHNKRICKDGPVFLSTEVEI